jgi:hypothetical protein
MDNKKAEFAAAMFINVNFYNPPKNVQWVLSPIKEQNDYKPLINPADLS